MNPRLPGIFLGALLGLALGATAFRFLPRVFAPRPAATSVDSNLPAKIVDLADSVRTTDGTHPPSPLPTPLSPGQARAAIAAWLALGKSAGTTTPADFTVRATALRALLLRIPASEFAHLHQAMLPLTDRDSRQLLASAFAAWTEQAPAAAADWAARAPAAPDFDPLDLARSAALAWASLDPLAAAEWACALPDPARATALAQAVLPLLGERDPDRAIALAANQGDAVLDQLLPRIFKSLARQNPAAAFAAHGDRLWKNGDGFRGSPEFRAVLADWISRSPDAAIAWIRSHNDTDARNTAGWAQLFVIDGIVEPRLLATALASAPDLPGRQNALGEVFALWNARDTTAAFAWLHSLATPRLRSALLEQNALRYLGSPQLNLPFALALPSGPLRRERFQTLIASWAKTDPAAALAWSRAHPDDPDVMAATPKLHAAILGNIAREEPATALAEWKALPDGPTKTEAVSTIGEAWGRRDATAAFTWMAEQDAHLGRKDYPDNPRQSTFYAWSREQPLAALRWAETQEEYRAHTYLLLLSGAGSNSEGPPLRDTVELYAQLRDPVPRERMLSWQLGRWLAADPAAARAWIKKSDALTAEQRAKLLAKP